MYVQTLTHFLKKVYYRRQWPTRKLVFSVLVGVGLLIVSIIINYLAGTYATLRAGSPVSDLILDNIPVIDVGVIFVVSSAVFAAFVFWVMTIDPYRAPFVLKSVSLFVVIRALFIILTHLGPMFSADGIPIRYEISIFTFSGDFFFSGHTGMPFLLGLIFWHDRTLRYGFLGWSIFFALLVLIGHIHYSIDVFSAFFISYGIYHIALRMFREEYQLLRYG